ncbi:MAG: hypothetical protein AUH96_15490 [Nitrospirae bacterium 13_2_20CM_2_61_4]|nr:MAG: hypothetical protein AUH96_15490 [Nitrospirae bacterium 13_2_20CM_2_61_4]
MIRGPGLVEPIVIRGNMGFPPGDRYWEFALTMFGSSSDPSSDAPLSAGDLGPRYVVDYVEPCCGHRVRQYLYPYAAGGPVTYTPSGQRADMFQMNMDDYIGSSQTGWHRVAATLGATSYFVGWHKVAATLLQFSIARSGVNPTAAPAPSKPSPMWFAIGSTLLVLMGLMLIARRLSRSRTRGVLAGHGL